MEKDKICFIRPRLKNDYWYDAIGYMGYSAFIPYKDYNLLMRLLREVCFRFKLLGKELWFNSKILGCQAEIFIVKDPLMTIQFLKWLRGKKPHARIILDFDNRVGLSINPNDIDDKTIEKWSYDVDDCEKYSMQLKQGGYFDIYRICQLQKPVLDVVYLGRDKGRATQLIELKNVFDQMGLRTYFHICSSRSYMRFSHRYYRPIMTYTEYLSLISKSRAILNILPEGQRSITLREFEAVFDSIKCITNNAGVLNFDLYHPSRFFVLGFDEIEKLPEFLELPFLKVPEEKLEKYKFINSVKKLVYS